MEVTRVRDRIVEEIQGDIERAREGTMVGLDGASKAATILRGADKLSAFYNHRGDSEVNWVVATVTYMVSVAVAALTVAAAGGHQAQFSPFSFSKGSDDMVEPSLEDLLGMRREALL